MQKDTKYLLVILIAFLVVFAWMQNQYCTSPIPNTGSLSLPVPTQNNIQHFAVGDGTQNNTQPRGILKGLTQKNPNETSTSSRESQKVKSKIIDNILRNESPSRMSMTISPESKQNSESNYSLDDLSELQSEIVTEMKNPIRRNVDAERNTLYGPSDDSNSDLQVLDTLIKEVNTGNDLIVDNPRTELYQSKSRSINSAKKYRKVSYKDSEYRYDFNDDGSPSQTSQDELNSLYDNALVFRNNEYNTNGDFKGYDETNQDYGNANLKNFTISSPQSQQEKIMALYNSNEYLPNNEMLDKSLVKGFQILDNPVAVSNPNLLPVLKSIPVSSVMGSNKNQTYDIRAEPPCPKTVVSPFLNSSIMPDIYSTQRGCL